MAKHQASIEERIRGDMYGLESMKWYGWGSAIGLSFVIASVGFFIWMLHLADVIH